ncbi:hypothetical protein LSM04_001686 [Trypanosoma melophagium]|uniref:uncharacterized protein n=1 Tax=Trypanosoma melophagium TaxID=715481 RepID=UPI00351A4C6E|nr:hypothetical protein LSM04_001686 [Trypanosoma melophagium]
MLRRTFLQRLWLGGSATATALGHDVRPAAGKYINVVSPTDIAAGSVPPEANAATVLPVPHKRYGKWNRVLRSDIYDELLKLPLRFKLHDFSKLCPVEAEGRKEEVHQHTQQQNQFAVIGRGTVVGYHPPLGPADPLDTIPFFVHRNSNGILPGKVYSMNRRNLMPAFYMRIQGVEGDLFRFEEELMKIFPTKKIFVRSHSIYVYNVGLDGRMILHHWLLGLGF